MTTPSRTEIVPAAPGIVEIVEPLDFDRLQAAFKKFQEFKEKLLDKDDSVLIGSKRYLKKSAWRKWALACGISDEITLQIRTPLEGKTLEDPGALAVPGSKIEDQKRSFQWRIVVRAFHAGTGRSSIGVAIASSSEKKSWAHEEHDVYALAHTRAKNRAIADLVGGGEVSAEEVEPAQAWVEPARK